MQNNSSNFPNSPVAGSQPGVLALFRRTAEEDNEDAVTEYERRPVVAFTEDGAPLVVETSGEHDTRFLVRADADKRFAGMAYSSTVFGGLSSSQENRVLGLTDWEIAAVDFAALRALELAGKRQLTNAARAYRYGFRDVPTWEIHTQMQINNVDKALNGAFDLLRACMPGHDRVFRVIDEYVRERIATQRLHDTRKLLNMLSNAGCLNSTY